MATPLKFSTENKKIMVQVGTSTTKVKLDANGDMKIDKPELLSAGFSEAQAQEFLNRFSTATNKDTMAELIAMASFQKLDSADGATNKAFDLEVLGASSSSSGGSSSTRRSGGSASVSRTSGMANTDTNYSYTVKPGNTYDVIAEHIYNELYKDDGVDKDIILPKIKAAIIDYGATEGRGTRAKNGKPAYPFAEYKGGSNTLDLNEALKDIDPQPKAFSTTPAEETPPADETPAADDKKDEQPSGIFGGLFGGLFGGGQSDILRIIAMFMIAYGGGGLLGLFDNNSSQQPQYAANNNGGLFNGLFS